MQWRWLPTERLKIEEADCSSGGQTEYDINVLVHGSAWPRSRRGTLHLGHTVLGRKESGSDNGIMNKEKRG